MPVLVTTRMYDPDTGLMSNGQADMLSFGVVAPNTKSQILVIDAVISGVHTAGDLGIGIANANLNADSMDDVLYYNVINSLDAISEPTLPFSGMAGYNGTDHVIDVGFRDPLVSRYVVLMIKAKNKPIECGCLIMKWFFGFDIQQIGSMGAFQGVGRLRRRAYVAQGKRDILQM